MKAVSMVGFLILGSLVSGPVAGQIPDVVIPGAGSIGPWKTQVQVFNGSESLMIVRLAAEGYEQTDNPDCSDRPCAGALDLPIPAHHFAAAVLSDAVHGIPDGPWTFRVQLRYGLALPSVSARMYNTQDASQSFEIPVVRADSLATRNPSALTFPDAIASGKGGRSNLVIAAIGGDVRITLQGFTADGAEIQSMTYDISAGTTLTVYDVFKNYLLGDAIPQIFVPLLVTKVDGSGTIWGYLVAIDDQGGVAAEAGLNW